MSTPRRLLPTVRHQLTFRQMRDLDDGLRYWIGRRLADATVDDLDLAQHIQRLDRAVRDELAAEDEQRRNGL